MCKLCRDMNTNMKIVKRFEGLFGGSSGRLPPFLHPWLKNGPSPVRMAVLFDGTCSFRTDAHGVGREGGDPTWPARSARSPWRSMGWQMLQPHHPHILKVMKVVAFREQKNGAGAVTVAFLDKSCRMTWHWTKHVYNFAKNKIKISMQFQDRTLFFFRRKISDSEPYLKEETEWRSWWEALRQRELGQVASLGPAPEYPDLVPLCSLSAAPCFWYPPGLGPAAWPFASGLLLAF